MKKTALIVLLITLPIAGYFFMKRTETHSAESPKIELNKDVAEEEDDFPEHKPAVHEHSHGDTVQPPHHAHRPEHMKEPVDSPHDPEAIHNFKVLTHQVYSSLPTMEDMSNVT